MKQIKTKNIHHRKYNERKSRRKKISKKKLNFNQQQWNITFVDRSNFMHFFNQIKHQIESFFF